jgi:hypothetical protein
MSIDYADLEAWFKERPQWLQDAARRLFQTGGITADDAADLLILCKREAGVAVTDKPDLMPVPISASALPVTGTGVPLRLTTISEVQGINALAPRSPLSFGDKHLTVIYGHNGSGKSGYIRILKHLCGGRGMRTLHKNVFDKAEVDQRCKVSYTHGTTNKEVAWTPKDGTHADLSSISLFDSDCANVYINDENQIAYEPTLLCYFRELAEICDALAAKLKAEMVAKVSAKPALPSEYAQTPAAVWYGGITPSTTEQAITAQCAWTKANDTFIVVLTIGCVWLGWRVDRAHKRGRAIDAVNEAGGYVYYYEDLIKSHRCMPRKSDFAADIIGKPVEISGVQINGAIVAQLKKIRELKQLRCRVACDGDVHCLEGLGQVRHLIVYYSPQVSQAALLQLRERLPKANFWLSPTR